MQSPTAQLSDDASVEELRQVVARQEERMKELERLLSEKDSMIDRLERQVDQFQAVLELKRASRSPHSGPSSRCSAENSLRMLSVPTSPTLSAPGSIAGASGLAVPSSDHDAEPERVGRRRAQGISAEPNRAEAAVDYQLDHCEKPQQSKELIKKAIMDNEFLKNLEPDQVTEIVECMFSLEFFKHDVIVQEGEVGNMVYVLEDGTAEVTKEGHRICKLGPGKVFGELAILYNCTRTATVRAVTGCKVWAIERQGFQSIMMKTGLMKRTEHIEFLKSIPAFKTMSDESVCKMADLLEECHYANGDYIIRQGGIGETFYIIAKGRVRVTQNIPGTSEEKYIKTLYTGDFFGERALQNEDKRSANVIAWEPSGVDCLVINRDTYRELMSSFESTRPSVAGALEEATRLDKFGYQFQSLRLSDLSVLSTLGLGGFARVELVQIGDDSRRTYALKQMSKKHIVDTRQEEHVLNEKTILQACDCQFICRLYRTFKDRKYLYMLLESCLGGEVWTLMRDRGHFDEVLTRFYIGCVVEAFGYLHALGIVYRDLKPENLMLDSQGYVKLVDFGFAKKVGPGGKTWTFCGTPEYVAPEVILNKGHDMAADLWSLGILIFEMLNGIPPFSFAEPMKTYSAILRGIDAVDFPKTIGKAAQTLIKKLCRDAPTERLGYGRGGINDIRKHIWFDGFNWDGLQKRSIKAPYIPKIKNAADVSNFDSFQADDEAEPPDDTSGWDKDF